MKGRTLMADIADVRALALFRIGKGNAHFTQHRPRYFRRRFIPNHIVKFISHLRHFIRRFCRNGRPFEAFHDFSNDFV